MTNPLWEGEHHIQFYDRLMAAKMDYYGDRDAYKQPSAQLMGGERAKIPKSMKLKKPELVPVDAEEIPF